MSQKVSVPVLPHVYVFMLQYMGKSTLTSMIHVERDGFLGKLFEGAMSKVPFELPKKYVPNDSVLLTFVLSDEYDSLTLTDSARNILGQTLNYFFTEMFGFGGACQSAITQNENQAAKFIIKAFDMEDLYESNSGRHVVARRKKRIAKAQNRRIERNFMKNFRHTRTQKVA